MPLLYPCSVRRREEEWWADEADGPGEVEEAGDIDPGDAVDWGSKPPQPVVSDLGRQNLPDDFPFAPSELGLEPGTPRRPTPTQITLGLAEPPPPAGEEPDDD